MRRADLEEIERRLVDLERLVAEEVAEIRAMLAVAADRDAVFRGLGSGWPFSRPVDTVDEPVDNV